MAIIKRLLIIVLLLMVSACTPEESEEVNKEPEELAPIQPLPTHSYDTTVTITGTIHVEEEIITIHGKTSAPPGSRIESSAQSDGIAVASFIDTATVDTDGTFTFSFDRPSKDIDGQLKLVVTDPDALSVYGMHYEQVTSPQKVELNQMNHYQIQANYFLKHTTVAPFEQTIELPSFNPPNNYGEHEITLSIEQWTDHQYVYLKGLSNIVEGTAVSANLMHIYGGIDLNAFDRTTTLPDGSFLLKVPYKSLETGYYIPVELRMSKTTADRPLSTYGKKGESLEGEWVKEDKKEKYIEQIIDVHGIPLSFEQPIQITKDKNEVLLTMNNSLWFSNFEIPNEEVDALVASLTSELQQLSEGTTIEIFANHSSPTVSKAQQAYVYKQLKEQQALNHLTFNISEKSSPFPQQQTIQLLMDWEEATE